MIIDKLKKYRTFCFGLLFLLLGVLLIFIWPLCFSLVLDHHLVLSENSTSYNQWKETNMPVYLEMYFFNFTNAKEYSDDRTQPFKITKPKFQQLGPYTFHEKQYKVDIVWNENDTVTYRQKKIWHFIPEKSNGTLNDTIFSINPLVAAGAYSIRLRPVLALKSLGVLFNKTDEKFYVNKTVNELLFKGYRDHLLDIMLQFNSTKLFIPFDKVGWFYTRNNSKDFDGKFNIFTGADNINKLGKIFQWNDKSFSNAYAPQCNLLRGTPGELWPPFMKSDIATIFLSDICSSVDLNFTSSEKINGLEVRKYVGTDFVFDNGTKYPSRKCYNTGEILPSGVLNISSCRWGTPGFVSYPHFYKADPFYLDSIEGLAPNKSEHELSVSFDSITGIPVDIKAQLQINVLIDKYDGFKMFNNVKKTLIPTMWFRQKVVVPNEFIDKIKFANNFTIFVNTMAYLMCTFGLYLIVVYIFLESNLKVSHDVDVQTKHNFNF